MILLVQFMIHNHPVPLHLLSLNWFFLLNLPPVGKLSYTTISYPIVTLVSERLFSIVLRNTYVKFAHCMAWTSATAQKRETSEFVFYITLLTENSKMKASVKVQEPNGKRIRKAHLTCNKAYRFKHSVVIGNFYEPSLLPDFSSEFGLIKNKLLQHDVLNINDELIPAWKLEEGLRPGTIILASVTLHVYNIDNKGMQAGFRRVSVHT